MSLAVIIAAACCLIAFTILAALVYFWFQLLEAEAVETPLWRSGRGISNPGRNVTPTGRARGGVCD